MMKQRLAFLLVIIWMLFIFVWSHQTGPESSETSGKIIRFLSALGIGITSRTELILHHFIRKVAHFFEYFILSLLLFNYLRELMEGKGLYLWPISISFLYACSDEIHQIYVPGRVGSWKDVVIDTAGASVAMLLVFAYRSLRNHRKPNHKVMDSTKSESL